MIQQQERSLEIIDEEIEILRCTLNEIVADMEESEQMKEETIELSRELDELINEYIRKSESNKSIGFITFSPLSE